MTRKIKNHPSKWSVKEVFEDGVKIAEYWFCRDRRDQNGRIDYTFTGEARYVDGRVVNLASYGYAADVARDFREGVL